MQQVIAARSSGSSVVLLACALGLASAVSCSGNEDGAELDDDSESADGTGEEPAGPVLENSSFNGLAECDASCQAGTYCSYSGECIANNTCAVSADCGPGRQCEKGSCTGECGDQAFQLAGVAPNVLVVLDRSCSMPFCPNYDHLEEGKNCWNKEGPDKWVASVNVLADMAGDFEGRIRWGLELYPDIAGKDCRQEEQQILPSPNGGKQMAARLLAALSPDDPYFPDAPCVTNTFDTLVKTAKMPTLRDRARSNYVVLITDGREANCTRNKEHDKENIEKTKTIIANMNHVGIKTIVIGFNTEAETDDLNDFATAGGLPNPSEEAEYYPVGNAEQLKQTLGGIIGDIVSCDFTLDQEPVNPNKLFVFFDDEQLEQGGANGWNYSGETNTISFTGESCSRVKSGNVKVDVAFGCDGVPIY